MSGTTRRRKPSSTGNVSKAQDRTKPVSTLPPGWALSDQGTKYEVIGYQLVGLCGTCMKPLLAKQPGGLDPIHQDGTDYCGMKKSENTR
jgi:hypothetical protein